MAKGFEVNKKRKDELNVLGRDLARRSESKCELCQSAGVRLNVVELSASSETPDIENCVFICDECYSGLSNPSKLSEHWRCLSSSIWSDVKPVKILSAIVLKKISEKNSWAEIILEEVYFEKEELKIIGES